MEMPRFAYVDGRFVPHHRAMVHVEDRGFQFADGVYEVIAVEEGRLVDEGGHIDRLDRSLRELRIDWPIGRRGLDLVMRELVRRNRVQNGLLYVQITRGTAVRDFKFPSAAKPTLAMTARRGQLHPDSRIKGGVRVVTVPDLRWKRCDIKSIALLPQVLAKQEAAEHGAFEAWMVDEEGYVTEGSSSSSWIVTSDGTLVTRQISNAILKGVTRNSLIRLAQEEGLTVQERAFTVEEAYTAREAFMSSASTYAQPIVQIDDRVIGNGVPGSLALKLFGGYVDYARGRRP